MSYSFEQVTQFKIGERYWESSQYGNLNFEVTTKPVVEEASYGRTVEFWAKAVQGGHAVRYFLTEGYEHYGPRIYDMPMYMTRDQLVGEKKDV